MEILSINADQKLMNLASTVGRNPRSWKGWFCLTVRIPNADDDLYQDCILWAKSIVESYLKDIEGRVYVCGNKTIHILCKTETAHLPHQTGLQLCELICAENGLVINYTIYNLVEDGFLYAQTVLEQADNIFSLPVSIYAGLGTVEKILSESSDDTQIPVSDVTKPVRVLLVEDDPVTRWMVRNTLKSECEFITAPTANKAYGIYNSYQPDVVFLDINLPDGDGYGILKWILRNDPGACVVMFSSNDNLDNISCALDEGASGFIAKPFSKEQLLHYVQHQT